MDSKVILAVNKKLLDRFALTKKLDSNFEFQS